MTVRCGLASRLGPILVLLLAGCGGDTLLATFDGGTGEPHLLGEECRGPECPLDEADGLFLGPGGGWLFAAAIAIVGDVDGDGYDDIVIGGQATRAAPAAAYVVYGGPTIGGEGPMDRADARLSMGCVECDVGAAVASAGDFNGDGLADFLVGAPGDRVQDPLSTTPAFVPQEGIVYLVLGSSERLDGEVDLESLPNRVKLVDGRPIGSAGTALAGVGDMDGDGFDDILIGAEDRVETGWPGRGGAYLVYGGAAHAPVESLDDVGVLYRGSTEDGGFGRRLAGAGDLDGDGLDDIAMGENRAVAPEGSRERRTYIVYGSATRESGTIDLADVSSVIVTPGSEGDPPVGAESFDGGLAGGGDLDGDGFDDLLIGRLGNAAAGPGSVQLIYGRGERFAEETDPSALGPAYLGLAEDGSRLGHALAVVGDVEGDGLDDFLVGSSARGSGGAYLVLGAARPAADPSFADAIANFLLPARLEAGPWPLFVAGVAGRGDVNGDEHADFLIGVGIDSSEVVVAGVVYLVLGAPL
jgi:hypothetical protein